MTTNNHKVFLFFFALFSVPAYAVENELPGDDSLRPYGFITQGYFKTDDNSFYGHSEDGSFDFTEIGIGAQAVLNDRVRVSGLLLARKAGEADEGKLRIDHLFADISLRKTESSSLAVSVGRNKIPFGFYNATRDVAITRPTMLLPQSIYYDHSRNMLINADGLDLRYAWWNDDDLFKINLLYESPTGADNPQSEDYYLLMDWPGNLRAGVSTGLVFNADLNGGKTRFAAFVSTDHNRPIRYRPGVADLLGPGKIITDAMWLSVQHEVIQGLKLTSEVFTPRIRYRGFGPAIPDREVYPLGYYLQATIEVSPKLETYVRFDQTYKDREDKKGVIWNASTGQPSHRAFARDWTIGLNWFATKDLMLSAEFHHVDGTAFLPSLDNPNLNMTLRRWNMVGLQATYNFR